MIHVPSRLARLLSLGAIGALMVILLGCEEDITAVTGSDRPFSFYGVLRPQADTQFVSVYPITDRLAPLEPEPLDAEITATNTTTGETYQLRDSIRQEDDGQYAHFFWTPIRVKYGHTYEIEARNSADEVSSVEVTVPPSAELEIREPHETLSVGIVNPVFVAGDVPRLMKIEVEYHIKFDSGEPQATNTRMIVNHDDDARKVEGGWIIDINLSNDFETLRGRLQAQNRWSASYGIVMHDMTLRLAAVNEEWNPPGGSFDPEVLVQPGTMSNVRNGFGFVGAGFRLQEQWRPDTEYLEEAGWSTL